VDEMISDTALFSMEVAKRKNKTCGKENVDYIGLENREAFL
jgi:hypothetical protein